VGNQRFHNVSNTNLGEKGAISFGQPLQEMPQLAQIDLDLK